MVRSLRDDAMLFVYLICNFSLDIFLKLFLNKIVKVNLRVIFCVQCSGKVYVCV